jgi:hypothetical protein
MSTEPWHLNKSIPITFIFAIAAQTLALLWFVATLRNDVDNNTAAIARNEVRIATSEAVVQSQSVLLGRIDENIKQIKDALERR